MHATIVQPEPYPHPSLTRSRKVLDNGEDALYAALHLARRSVRLELVLVVPDSRLILVLLAEHAISDGKQVDVCSHEAAECVLWRAHNRLPTHVKARINQNWAAGTRLEAGEERVEQQVGFGVDRLHARRIIHVCNGRNIGAWYVQLVNPEQRRFLTGHASSALRDDVSGEEHVGTVTVHLEPVRHVFPKHDGCKWPKRLSVLDFQIEVLLHRGRTRVA